MTTSLRQPDDPADYDTDGEIPFTPDGNSSIISGSVDRVRGSMFPFQGMHCARKTVIIPNPADRNSIKHRLRQETKALHNSRHKHVVQLFHSYFDNQHRNQLRFCIIMERAEENLANYLTSDASPANLPDRRWLGCLLVALQHIHGLGIRHRDIKPGNILVKNNKVLLADFGISQMGLGKTIPTTRQGRSASRSTEFCAPEVEEGNTRGRSADVFSLGAVFLLICVMHSGPGDYQSLADVLRLKKPEGFASNIDHVHDWIGKYELSLGQNSWQSNIVQLCKMMLQLDRDRRPLASALELSDLQLSCTCIDTVPVTQDSRLLEACKSGSTDDVERLLCDGANPHLPGAIHLAAERGCTKIVEIFLEKGADANSRNQVEQTPLHCASRSGRDSVVRLLLDSSSLVNAQDEEKQTPLHGAAAHGYESIVRMLLHAGAKTEVKNAMFKRPYSLAKGRGHTGVLRTLDNWMKN